MEDIEIKQEPEDYVEYGTPDVASIADLSSSLADESTSNSATNIKEEVLETLSPPNFDNIKEFCFESDHLALKSNSDYKNLLEAIVILEAQRAQAIKDMDCLLECQETALSDPIAFAEKLQRKENLNIPVPQKLHQLPVIDWSKYALSGNASAFGRRQLTRLSTKTSQDFSKFNNKGKTARNNETKSSKLNQYWTAEEQKRLEELLVQFPPEEVETRRWEKIANCLENRTPIQVASRVQKYFIKLMKAGIPIPGRMPSIAYLRKPRRNIIRQQPSTFLVSHTPPVYMPDVDEDYNYNYSQPQSADENSMESKVEQLSDDDEIGFEHRNTAEFQELMMLKKVLKEKLKSCGLAQHVGYKCCRCKSEPIIGIRWHCTECKPPQTIDFCDDCVECMHEVGQHTADHRLEAIHNASTGFLDRDYMHFLGSDYNYLDPNYMPAT
ncbi:ZZ-type zinc finger-containing protein 3-like [Uloborus diversus]|uniref:ZZ-type zinc finger-containing protein 3-like n=1 Tax=Uloborus diversus TaxID=327109 RepID=UPI002409ECED|nr:ZZ-type zinc finger-containing protein 3-like [Uloborus diversus]XP_054711651.1 ZZ-type zinc finger-containing protein 3-like [Uloborus diversus]